MNNPPRNSTLSAPTCETNPLEKARWFEDEVHAHDAVLKSYLRGSFPSIDVEDIAQESYMRTWLAHMARPVRSAKAFLFTVARHLALNSIRREKRSPITAVPDLTVLDVADEGRGVAESAAIRDEIALLADAINTLPPRCREILILRKIQCLPQREVAARLGITENTVEEQFCRGICRIEAFFIRHGVIKPWQKNT